MITGNLQMKKLKHGEVQFFQGHSANKWQSKI